MSRKVAETFILLLLYLPALVLGNMHATVCMTEQGEMQIEFGMGVCDTTITEAASSTPLNDCGDCADSKVKVGETRRVTLGNSCDLFQSQTAFVSIIHEQYILPASTHIESNTSTLNLIGSSILII